MKLNLFIAQAEVMRKGGIPQVVAPRSYGFYKARRHHRDRLESAYAAILRFNVKHPDSTRTERARMRSLELRFARRLKEAA